jgi:Rrf2 family transcriptional regulator, iron-sulfur cluster assembly transcription factor
MKITTKGRLAIEALLDVASHQRWGPVTTLEVSERRNISVSYLEQLFGILRRHGLVESTRGPGGGYTLARPSQDISVANIIYAVDGPNASSGEQQETVEATEQHEVVERFWVDLHQKMMAYLQSITLQFLHEQLPPVPAKRLPAVTGHVSATYFPTSTLQKITPEGVRVRTPVYEGMSATR